MRPVMSRCVRVCMRLRSESDKKQVLLCPIDRDRTSVDAKGVDALKKNFGLIQLLQMVYEDVKTGGGGAAAAVSGGRGGGPVRLAASDMPKCEACEAGKE